jgi:hypothetical protein
MNSAILVPDYRLVFASEMREAGDRPDLDYGLSYYLHCTPVDMSFEEARLIFKQRLDTMFANAVGASGARTIEYLSGLPVSWIPSSHPYRDAVQRSGRNYVGHVSYGMGPVVMGMRGTHGEHLPSLRVIATFASEVQGRMKELNKRLSEDGPFDESHLLQDYTDSLILNTFADVVDRADLKGFIDPGLILDQQGRGMFSLLHSTSAFGTHHVTQEFETSSIPIRTGPCYICLDFTQHQLQVLKSMFPSIFLPAEDSVACA